MSRKRRTRTSDFRKRVTFYKQSTSASANTDGQIPATAAEQVRRWVRVEPLRGTERFQANQTKGAEDYRVVVRYDQTIKDINRKWWLVLDDTSQRLNIVSVANVGMRNREIELMCKEKV